MTKFSINKCAAGAFYISCLLRRYSTQIAIELLNKEVWNRPAHTPTIRRLAKKQLLLLDEKIKKSDDFMEKEIKEEQLFLSLSATEKQELINKIDMAFNAKSKTQRLKRNKIARDFAVNLGIQLNSRSINDLNAFVKRSL